MIKLLIKKIDLHYKFNVIVLRIKVKSTCTVCENASCCCFCLLSEFNDHTN